MYFTVGIHPRCCTSIQKDDLVNLENNLVSWGRVVALGEVGIDYTGGYSPAECEAQRTALRSMLPLAVRLDLPVVVRVRDVGISRLASQHCLEILRECLPESHVIHRHCFTGGMSELNEWMTSFPNAVFGFTVTILQPDRNQDLWPVLNHLPLSSMVLETDSPYLVPPELHKRVNNPGCLPLIADKVAFVRSQPLRMILWETRQTACRVYQLPG